MTNRIRLTKQARNSIRAARRQHLVLNISESGKYLGSIQHQTSKKQEVAR